MSSSAPPPAGPGPTPGLLAPRRLIMLPFTDLLINQVTDQKWPILPSWQPVLALGYGLGPNEPRVLRTDDAGNLLVAGSAGAVPAAVRIQDGTGAGLAAVVGDNGTTGLGTALLATTMSINDGQGGRRFWGPASAFMLGATSSGNAALVAPPGQWSVQHSPATGAKATISQAAGGAGVRNVCTGFSFGFSSGVAVAATTIQVNLRDGATGAGIILQSWIYDLAAAIIVPFTVEETGFEIPGSAATAMTLEFTALLANLHEFVNLSGHLAG